MAERHLRVRLALEGADEGVRQILDDQYREANVAFARYVEDWRLKIERVGNLNYPEVARQQRL